MSDSGAPGGPEGAEQGRSFAGAGPLALAMQVHDELSGLIHPVTPETIRASSVWRNKIFIFFAAAGFLALIALIWASFLPDTRSAEGNGGLSLAGTLLGDDNPGAGAAPAPGNGSGENEAPGNAESERPDESEPSQSGAGDEGAAPKPREDDATTEDTPDNEFKSILKRISGAVLGATLFAFWTARPYLRDGTFKPSLSQDYLIRFAIGVVAGLVIGSVVAESKTFKDFAGAFGSFTIAVVGGYSAQAVIEILQRISEILVATVRGNDTQRAREEAQREASRQRQDTASRLQEALNEEDQAAIPDRVRAIISDMNKA